MSDQEKQWIDAYLEQFEAVRTMSIPVTKTEYITVSSSTSVPNGTLVISQPSVPLYVKFDGRTFVSFDPAAVLPGPDLSRYPHNCPRCKSPAYVGLEAVDCSRNECK